MKKFSHLFITKLIVFVVVIICFTETMKSFLDIEQINDDGFGIVFEDDYFHSYAYVQESERIVWNLTRLLEDFKSEEHILKGGTISEEEIRNDEDNLYYDFQTYSRSYNPELSEEENYAKFKEEYADKLSQAREEQIKIDLREFHTILQELEEYENPLYFASDGVNVYSNTSIKEKQQFKSHPSYMIFENYKQEMYPKEVSNNEHLYQVTENIIQLDSASQNVYIAFTEDFLNSKIKEWKENKEIVQKSLYEFLVWVTGFIISLVYLILVIGRKSFKDEEVHLNKIDKLYTDVNIVLCFLLLGIWFTLLEELNVQSFDQLFYPVTLPIGAAGLVLFLSLIRHVKNRTIFKHSFVYKVINKLIQFVRDVYESGNVAIKTVLLVIGYPLLVVGSFFMFPVTIGVAAWVTLRRVKSFKAIQEGVERIKGGDIQHTIEVNGKGEFASLAANINSMTDGLKNAVHNELKSERLKTELITNVSHDIRTPLTSIITYVDLLKNEEDLSKVQEYVEVLDQKSKRLKTLTDDLFEAAKASSGNIPVHYERIDLVSLITQGLGEVNSKIEELELDFKLNFPKHKVFITADGKLLWRSLENVLSNIFKYALKGSRVYIDIEEKEKEILITFKNISAYELNISADELMERFKRGDESRSSQGSGLGLSITKSLIEIQNGRFNIQVDGDLFKSMIFMPKESSKE